MIFVAAGTQDGRELAGFLLGSGYEVTASVVSQYGGELLEEYQNRGLVVNKEPLDENALEQYIQQHAIDLFVDASHPYAVNVSANAMAACHEQGIPYIRYERKASVVTYKKAYLVQNYEEAAQKAAELGKAVFLTTGSRNLEVFANSPYLQECTLTARVLPEPEVIAGCIGLGFQPAQIIAMQGPFSRELNMELYKKYKAEVIVTKNSGQIGGTDTKFAAAMELDLPVVLIDRPKVQYDHLAQSFAGVLAFAKKVYGNADLFELPL